MPKKVAYAMDGRGGKIDGKKKENLFSNINIYKYILQEIV